MEPVRFKEVNRIIAKDDPNYDPIPARFDKHSSGMTRITTCWKLNLDEISQIQRTGILCLQQLSNGKYPPIIKTFLKPDDITMPEYGEEDEE